VYAQSLPQGSLGSARGRIVAKSVASTDVLELGEHGLVDGTALVLRATEGGSVSSPLVDGGTVYAIRLTDSTFKVAASKADALAGIPINLTSDGVSMVAIVPIDWDTILERYSRWVDGFLPAHAVPLKAPYPLEIVGIVCDLAAARAQWLSGVTSISMHEHELAAKAQAERFAAGLPVRDARVTTSTNTAIVGSASNTTDPRGWGSRTLP
jgi:hypothetical protein